MSAPTAFVLCSDPDTVLSRHRAYRSARAAINRLPLTLRCARIMIYDDQGKRIRSLTYERENTGWRRTLEVIPIW